MTSVLWIELHNHALNYDPNTKNDLVWLQQWSKKIPRFTKGCSCNEHWAKWYMLNPPNFTSVEKYFAWTVKAHNSVNERLGKPIISVDQAKLLYSKK